MSETIETTDENRGAQTEQSLTTAAESDEQLQESWTDYQFDDEAQIVTEDLNVYYGDDHALKDISMEIPEKSVTALIGPSGCGKSTFLRCLNRMNDRIDVARIEGRSPLTGRRSTKTASTSSSCASVSEWCFSNQTRSRSRSATTSPTARASTVISARVCFRAHSAKTKLTNRKR